MKTEDYLRAKLRRLTVQIICNLIGTGALVSIAVVLWMLWAGGKL